MHNTSPHPPIVQKIVKIVRVKISQMRGLSSCAFDIIWSHSLYNSYCVVDVVKVPATASQSQPPIMTFHPVFVWQQITN